MQFERDSIAGSLGGGNIGQAVAMPTIPEAAKTGLGVDEDGRLADSDLRRRITDHLMENHAFRQTMKRAAEDARASNGPSNAAAIMKYAGAKIAQERNELMVEAMGHQGLGWGGDGFSDAEVSAMRTMLRSKANSIEGGTSEINLNIVAKRVLGLPDPKK
jgi:alkylation response protein AidB-like acyl-CoA dehydrogenase